MKILVIFAHPRLSSSIVHKAMLSAIRGLDGIATHDLYAAYPDFAIDVAREQARLLASDFIVLQHPFYWYSCPSIIKEWLDLVLEIGWAYGPDGQRLHRKFAMSAISTGGGSTAYRAEGRNRFEIGALLSPFDQTAHLCGMGWLEPFVIHEGRRLAASELDMRVDIYRNLLIGLRDGAIDPMSRLAKGYALPVCFSIRAA